MNKSSITRRKRSAEDELAKIKRLGEVEQELSDNATSLQATGRSWKELSAKRVALLGERDQLLEQLNEHPKPKRFLWDGFISKTGNEDADWDQEETPNAASPTANGRPEKAKSKPR